MWLSAYAGSNPAPRIRKMKKLTKTNPEKIKLIDELNIHSSKEGSKFWKRISNELQKSTRRTREVSIAKLNKYTKQNEIILVPGKVLSDGELTHKITIAAFSFSTVAKNKLKDHIISIHELLKKDPKGKKIRIIG